MRGVRAETELEELGVTVAKRQKWDGPGLRLNFKESLLCFTEKR